MQFFQNVYTTNNLIRAILTTTPSYSHVSNFRSQPRTDSRADKPDTFPGFDLTDEATPSPRKRRRQAYSQLLRRFIEKTRERLETIRDVVRDEQGLHFQLVRPDDDDDDFITNPSNGQLKALNTPDIEGSGSAEVVYFKVDDTDDSDRSDVVIESRPNLPQAYFSSLLTAIGFKRIPKQSVKNEKQTASDNNSIVTTYLLNPLLNIWHQAREKLNFNSNYRSVDTRKNNGNENAAEKNTLNSFENAKRKLNINTENTENNTNSTQAIDETVVVLESTVVTTKEPSSSSSDNGRSVSLPFKLSANNSSNKGSDDDSNASTINNDEMNNTSNSNENNTNNSSNIDSDSDDITIFNEIVHNADSSVQRAATAFQNAFLKYANYNGGNNENATNGTFEELDSLPNELLDSFLNDQMNNIQVIPLDKYKNYSMNSTNDVRSSSIETAGIFVLEIFGTVIGLTWGAFSHVQNWFNNSTKIIG